MSDPKSRRRTGDTREDSGVAKEGASVTPIPAASEQGQEDARVYAEQYFGEEGMIQPASPTPVEPSVEVLGANAGGPGLEEETGPVVEVSAGATSGSELDPQGEDQVSQPTSTEPLIPSYTIHAKITAHRVLGTAQGGWLVAKLVLNDLSASAISDRANDVEKGVFKTVYDFLVESVGQDSPEAAVGAALLLLLEGFGSVRLERLPVES